MTSPIKIEFLADYPEHIEKVSEWYFQWFHNSKGDFLETHTWVKSLLGKNNLPTTVIALQGNIPVGVGGIWQKDHKDLPNLSPWLASVYVPEEYRKKGIARMLLKARLDIARKLGFKKVYMWSEEKNWPIHQKLGWNLVDKEYGLFEINLDQAYIR